MSSIRALREEDIPAVVALRKRCFAHSAQTSDAALGDYIHTLCFRHPWPREELPSLVLEAKDNSIAAFLGVLPRPMQFQGERLWMAVSSQFMVDPAQSGLGAIKLLKTFLAGPQDLSMSDLVNDNSRKVWQRLGARTVYPYSQNWNRVFRPLAYRAIRTGGGLLPQTVVNLLDRIAVRLPGAPFGVSGQAPAGQCEVIDVTWLCQHIDKLSTSFELLPEYSEDTFNWLLDRVRDDQEVAELVLRRVVDGTGQMAGWFLYTLKRDGLADIVQMVADADRMPLVHAHLLHDVRQRGAVALNGRFQPENLRTVVAEPLQLSRSGPWMMLDSGRPELREEILAGGALLTRLEGEWWMHF